MVFFQSLPRINKNLIKKNILSLDTFQNSKEIMDDLLKNPSFSLVCLFLKFIKEDYFTYGELSSFKNFFEEKKLEYVNFLIKCQELKNNVEEERSDLEETHSDKYNTIINTFFSTLNIQNSSQHDHEKKQFTHYLDKDIFDLTKHNSYSNFYIIQEDNSSLNFYALFIYYQYQKLNLIIYNPKIGLKKFDANEIELFKETFDKIIKKSTKKYLSYKIKIDKEKVKKQITYNVSLKDFQEIIQKTTKKFNQYMAEKNHIYLSQVIKDDIALSQFFVPIDNKGVEHEYYFNIFVLRISEYIHKLKNNLDIIYEKSFWIIFLINYYSHHSNLKEVELCALDPFLSKEKIYDFLVNFYNKKCTISSYQSKKIICLIVINTYKQLILNKQRIPYFSHLKTFEIIDENSNLARKITSLLPNNLNKTLQDWNNINVIYNERHISKRFNGTFQAIIGFGGIGKTIIQPTVKKIPTAQQFENHFITSTNCNDSTFCKYSMGLINSETFDNLSFLFNSKNTEYMYNQLYKYIFIQKTCPQLYDFCFVYYIDEIKKNDEIIKLQQPILFSIVFPLAVNEDKANIVNFQLGILNSSHTNLQTEEFKRNIISKVFS